MKKNKILLLTTLVVFVLASFSTASLWADEKKEDDDFSGSFMMGYRMVDVEGVETKYMEDINLEKGPRLFHFKLHFAPQGKLKKLFDYMDLRIYNFGGDPFESMGIDVGKYNKYQFKYDRRKSTYFYSDMLAGHDFHTFDFERINDSGYLKVWLGKKAHAFMDFNRYTKKGASVTTLDMGRVEFEFDKPIDEESTEITLGFDYSCKGFSFVLQEKIQDYENANSMFLPGYADGGSGARYPTALNYFHLNQPYDMEGYTHSARFTAVPFKNFMLRGSLQITKQDTDFSYFEDAAGLDYLGGDVMYANSGAGNFTRKIQLYDLDFTYIFSNKFALVGAARYNNFDQEGSITTNGETTGMTLKYETGGVEAGLQFQPSATFGITLGYRFERRDVEDEVEISDVNEPTDRTGIFGNIKWSFYKKCYLTADYQYGTYDNPFTLISPTDFHRFRLTAKCHFKKVYVSGSYLYNKSESDQDGTMWEANKNQLNLRIGFHDKKVKWSAGYSLIDVTRKGDRTVYYPPAWTGGEGNFMWDILYEGKSNLFDAYLHFYLDKAWGLGGYFNYYENKGSWELTRTTLKAFLKHTFQNGFIGQLGYRLVDFKEKEFGYNDYKANIFEISFGYKW